MILLTPIHDTLNAVDTVKIYRDRVWSKYGLPRKIISDRGPQFVNQFVKNLYAILGIKGNLSTAYHPQMDGQME